MNYSRFLSELAEKAKGRIDQDAPVLAALKRATELLDNDRYVDPGDVDLILRATVLVAGEDAEALVEESNIDIYETETVRHYINLGKSRRKGKASGATLQLGFISEGTIHTTLQGSCARKSSQSFQELIPFLSNDSLTPSSLALAYGKSGFSKKPHCYLCNSEFIGIITTQLVEIDGRSLSKALELIIQKDSFEITEDPCGIAKEAWDEILCLKDLRRAYPSQAKRDYDSKDVELLSSCIKSLAVRKECISIDDIASSYAKGCVIKYSPDCLTICISQEPDSDFCDDLPLLAAVRMDKDSQELSSLFAFLERLMTQEV